jgi:7-cyano-7-deazaguanine reductase
MATEPTKKIETFTNPKKDRNYVIKCECPEFTCLCPKTGQPDFANIDIEYIPFDDCIELKSLKLYLWLFRNEGAFHEAVTNQILDDLVDACEPQWMEITAKFMVRGGITTTITATYGDYPADV